MTVDELPLLPQLDGLVRWHQQRCPPYARLLDAMWPDYQGAATLADLPWLPVGLFKSHRLTSIPPSQEFKTLTSSGTTGSTPSTIVLDRETAGLQTRGLARVMRGLLGPRRLPMLIVDVEDLVEDRAAFSARGAGVLGMMVFGRHHLHVLDADYRLRADALADWLARHGDQPFLVFGFTSIVWRCLLPAVAELGLDLSQGTLVHGGGWKKLTDQAVDRATFKQQVAATTGMRRVRDFYGMVEQVGGVYLEGDDGLLHPPDFADFIVRDPRSWQEAPAGQPGVIQLLSLLPRSYPGHSLLTEDIGLMHPLPTGGRALSVIGRAPRSELRGCSDTHAPVPR